VKHGSNPILVTGSHRSGSTWAGKTLAVAPHIAYIHEPFNPKISAQIGLNPKPFKYWFQYICEENSANYASILDNIIRYKYSLGNDITNIKTAGNVVKVIRDQAWCLLHKINRDRPLIKDPIALFSAEWLYKKYNMNVLVMIRHPAAFCSSLKIKKWEFNFNNFLRQPLLMERYLYPFKDEIQEYAENEKDVIEQAILLWNCIHSTIRVYQEKYPEWLFVRHEDLSADPLTQFKSIYNKFCVEFTQKTRKMIHESSGAHNPAEQQTENEFIRNSMENIKNWKKRCTIRIKS